jgi:uncharacterized tellurite resistance protein B-like protein
MHVIIGALTAVAGLIWALVALQRAGVNLGSLNPFLWYRRAQWRKKYGEKPLYVLDQPMDVAAVLLLGVAKCEGEISAEQKRKIRLIFEQEFRLNSDAASDLLLASSHLIRNEIYLSDNLSKILEKSSAKFTQEQVTSLLSLMQRVANSEGPPNTEQQRLIAATSEYFSAQREKTGTWN